MARMIHSVSSSSSKSPNRGPLFEGAKFWVSAQVPFRNSCIERIERHGGSVVLSENQADVKIVDHMKKNPPQDSFSYTYIEKSVRSGFLEDLEDHRVRSSHYIPRPVSSTKLPKKTTRTQYTEADMKILLDWVQKYNSEGGREAGNEMYKDLARAHPHHTWQSWRNKYVTTYLYHSSGIPGGNGADIGNAPAVLPPHRPYSGRGRPPSNIGRAPPPSQPLAPPTPAQVAGPARTAPRTSLAAGVPASQVSTPSAAPRKRGRPKKADQMLLMGKAPLSKQLQVIENDQENQELSQATDDPDVNTQRAEGSEDEDQRANTNDARNVTAAKETDSREAPNDADDAAQHEDQGSENLEESESPLEFTEEQDIEQLLEWGDAILNLDENLKDKAWQDMAEGEPNRTAEGWLELWETKAKHIYLGRKARERIREQALSTGALNSRDTNDPTNTAGSSQLIQSVKGKEPAQPNSPRKRKDPPQTTATPAKRKKAQSSTDRDTSEPRRTPGTKSRRARITVVVSDGDDSDEEMVAPLDLMKLPQLGKSPNMHRKNLPLLGSSPHNTQKQVDDQLGSEIDYAMRTSDHSEKEDDHDLPQPKRPVRREDPRAETEASEKSTGPKVDKSMAPPKLPPKIPRRRELGFADGKTVSSRTPKRACLSAPAAKWSTPVVPISSKNGRLTPATVQPRVGEDRSRAFSPVIYPALPQASQSVPRKTSDKRAKSPIAQTPSQSSRPATANSALVPPSQLLVSKSTPPPSATSSTFSRGRRHRSSRLSSLQDLSHAEEDEVIQLWTEGKLESGISRPMIQRALFHTGHDLVLADIVLDRLKQDAGVPESIKGVWTEEDDQVIDEDEDEEAMERIVRKHGTMRVVARVKFLQEARRESM